MYKQCIIVRKDLRMSPGKLAAQVSHGSMAFLIWMIINNTTKLLDSYYSAWEYSNGKKVNPQLYRRGDLNVWAEEARKHGESGFFAEPVDLNNPYGELRLCEKKYHYQTSLKIDNDLYEQWINGEFTKCVLQAKNKNQLLKSKTMAEELGMKEGEDFWLIYDLCRTELNPEDNNRTLTCIGFRPMESDIINKIGRKYHLYVG